MPVFLELLTRVDRLLSDLDVLVDRYLDELPRVLTLDLPRKEFREFTPAIVFVL